MGETSRRDFNKALASGFVGAGAAGVSMALGGNALAEEPTPNSNYRLAVLDFGYEGPPVSDYSNRPRAIREKLMNWLGAYGVPLRDPGTILAELELRGINYERFMQYPGILSSFDPKSNFIKDTDVIIGMCTDYERITDTMHPKHGRQQSLDTISVRYVDLERGDIITTLEEEGLFENNSMDRMLNHLAEGIAYEFKRIRDGH